MKISDIKTMKISEGTKVTEVKRKEFEQLLKLIEDLGWDYDRFSNSGQETYDEISKLLDWEK